MNDDEPNHKPRLHTDSTSVVLNEFIIYGKIAEIWENSGALREVKHTEATTRTSHCSCYCNFPFMTPYEIYLFAEIQRMSIRVLNKIFLRKPVKWMF